MSKAKDGEYSLGSPSYWRKYTYNNSTNIFAGGAPAGIVTTSFGAGASNFHNLVMVVGIKMHKVLDILVLVQQHLH